MLRITRLDGQTRTTVLRLEGRLTERDLAEFERVLGTCRREKRAVVLDLAGVDFLDTAAAAAIRDARRDRAELVGASSFIQQLIEEGIHP